MNTVKKKIKIKCTLLTSYGTFRISENSYIVPQKIHILMSKL